MEIALNSAIASTTHPIKIIGGSRYPTLLDHNDNICNKNYNVTSNKFFGVGHSILNLFGSSTEPLRSKEEINALASLTLKNALNVKSDNANKCDVQMLVEKAKDNEKKLPQCNSNKDLTQQQRKLQHQTKSPSKSSELLAALKVNTSSTTTSNQAKNKSLNISTSSSVSSSTSSSSTEAPSLTSSSVSGSSLSLLSSTLSTSPSTSAATTVQVTTSPTTTNSPNSTFTASTFTIESPDSRNGVGSGVGVASIKNGSQIPSDILDDLASRFIINVPDMELNNMIRICFQIELAHWFYLDFFSGGSAAAAVATEQQKQLLGGEANKKRKLPTCGIKQFAIQVFQHIPFLREHLSSIDKILDDWKNYKLAVPTFGAILISEDLNFCLLVQSYFAKCSWGFPKGKVNENEDPVHCATREVYEETGYDITHLIVPNDYIEAVINYQYTRLYIVRDVSLKTQFSPRTRNEIKCCDWFPIDSLPINKNDAISKAKLGLNANSFFMIMPFIKRLKRWVHNKRSGIETRKVSEGDNANLTTTNTPTTLMATAAVAAAAAAALAGNCNGTQNCNNNQKQFNAINGSSKKVKQQQQLQQTHNKNKSDDKLNIGSIGNTTTNNGNNNNNMTSSAQPAATNNNKTDNSSKRSKRQRHKSMGDLDGIKLNNLSSNNCKLNMMNTCKNNDASPNNIMVTASNVVESTTDSNENSPVAVGESGNCKTVAGQKRSNGSAVKLVAAGSSNIGHNNNSVAGATSKRHLFHSQSQNCCNQNGEKIVNSFDLIRKERQQQLKAAATAAAAAAQAEKDAKDAKAQRQQLQSNAAATATYNSGRVRAKSQGDKMYIQQHNAIKTSNASNNNTGGNLKNAVVQRQPSNSSTTTTKTKNNDNNYINTNYNNSNNITATNTARIASNPSPPSGGSELLALAAEIATSLSTTTSTATATTVTNTVQRQQQQQKQRPASVSLHFETKPILQAAGHQSIQQQQQQLQRMASGTNLRILKRSTSLQMQQKQQPQQQQHKQLQQQQQTEARSIPELQRSASFLQQKQQLQNHQQQTELKFKPSFNSWTNFSFTKNFIANVFC